MANDVAEMNGETFERGTKSRGGDAVFVVPDVVPDISVDGFEGAVAVNGLLRLNLVRFRALPDTGKTVREVVATLTMTSATANAFAVGLVDALNKQGMLAKPAVPTAALNGASGPEKSA